MDIIDRSWMAGVFDVDALGRWMDQRGLGKGPITDPTLLVGGTQNILIQFRREHELFVLRRPSIKPRSGADEVMLREARVLAALVGSAVPHPRLVAACSDCSIIGSGFYLMDAVDGFNPVGTLPESHHDATRQRAMGFALVDAIAALGSIDYEAVGLSNFGRVDGFLERQVPRWTKELDSYGAIPDWPGRPALPDLRPLGEWLTAHRPSGFRPGIMHGDFHVANVMYRRDGPTLAAVVDWELSTIGDPLLDLGWLIATWPGADGKVHSPTLDVRPWTGFPTASDLIARYGAQSQRDVSALDWYVALACYKLGIIVEGTYARAFDGKADPAIGLALHEFAIALFERGIAIAR